jgi:hypothetical protein
MYKQLVINVTERETRVALLEDGTIVELHVDRGDDSDIVGNIYKGKVLFMWMMSIAMITENTKNCSILNPTMRRY